MSATDGDSSSRLSAALDDLFSRREAGNANESPPESPAPSYEDDTDPTGAPKPPVEQSSVDEAALESAPVEPQPVQAAPAEPEPTTATPVVPMSVIDAPPYVLPEIVPATVDVPVVPSEVPTVPTLTPSARAAPPTEPMAPSVPVRPATPAPETAPASSWADHMPIVSAPGAGELRAAGRRPRVRRVTRVIRHVDPWSVFKVGLIFSLVTYAVMLTSGVLLWRVAESTGSIDNVERWFTQFGWETFEFNGGELFRNAWIIGLFGVVAMTGFLVLLATLFNLVSDIVGGVRVTVLEEEVVERTTSNARRYVVRRPVAAGAGASNWSVDDEPGTPTAESPTASHPDAAPVPPSAGSAEWSVDD
ncbi:MAG TPA: DUF3566 domain-containing protein [Ilumatobacter sp.]|nr:DUF3566 domain-containing protein [Ilumatobacter sp.]